MIGASPETEALLNNVELRSGKKFTCHVEIACLLDTAAARELPQMMEDILFYSKFITKASGILWRVGPSADETAKLAAEFRETIEKTSTLIRTLIKESPPEVKNHFVGKFLVLSQSSMETFLVLCKELSLVKNYLLDKEHHS